MPRTTATTDTAAANPAVPPAHVDHPTLLHALAAVQAELPRVGKDNTANVPGKEGRQGYSYQYADLADVSQAILPLLGRHGLSWVCQPTVDPELTAFGLRYALRHESGVGEDVGFYPLPDPRQTDPQKLGSAITYARRYVLGCATGVVPDSDDDGQAASSPAAEVRREREPANLDPVPEADRPAAAQALVPGLLALRSPAAVTAYKRDAGIRQLLDTPVQLPNTDEPMLLRDACDAYGRHLVRQREQAQAQPRQGLSESEHSQPPAGA